MLRELYWKKHIHHEQQWVLWDKGYLKRVSSATRPDVPCAPLTPTAHFPALPVEQQGTYSSGEGITYTEKYGFCYTPQPYDLTYYYLDVLGSAHYTYYPRSVPLDALRCATEAHILPDTAARELEKYCRGKMSDWARHGDKLCWTLPLAFNKGFYGNRYGLVSTSCVCNCYAGSTNILQHFVEGYVEAPADYVIHESSESWVVKPQGLPFNFDIGKGGSADENKYYIFPPNTPGVTLGLYGGLLKVDHYHEPIIKCNH